MADAQPWQVRWLGALARALGIPCDRRKGPRFGIPLHVPLHCIPADAMSFEAEIADVSRAGMAVMIYESGINLPLGSVLKGCTFVVPGGESIVVDLEVCSTSVIEQPGAGPAQRAGLKLLDGPKAFDALRAVLGARLDRMRDARRPPRRPEGE